MRDIALEIVVGVALAILGDIVLYPLLGPRVLEYPELSYFAGAMVFSVPAIAFLEWRRRKRK